MSIAELLPHYYEAYEKNLRYTPERIITIDGHEVAWMRYTGKFANGKLFEGYALKCECDFIEGLGWKLGPEGQRYMVDGEKRCLARQAAQHLRCLELRVEYAKRFTDDATWGDDAFALREHFEEIVLDLIEKAKANEFIGEDGNGAEFWGGYFYLQTVAAITDQFVGHLWSPLYAMIEKKLIGLEGAVIQRYRPPPPPEWEEFARVEDDDGWVGIASLPGHRKMAREWKLEVLNPDGEAAYGFIPGEGLLHDPVFGPDVEDVEVARRRLVGLIESAKHPPERQEAQPVDG